ncbi:MAG: hypothetical protein HGB05_16355 [Chloroflexi bacterium]|nr:hypothetical protein [Chloroflexota bacterium]
MSRFISHLGQRFGWEQNLKPFLEKPLPGKLDWTLTLGSVLALLFVVEAVTGQGARPSNFKLPRNTRSGSAISSAKPSTRK